jgi:hypothetical protein
MVENRRFPRYNRRLDVRYSKVGLAPVESSSFTKNVSRSGARLQISRLVKKGDTLKLEFYEPEKKESPIRAIGKIVWTREGGQFELDAGLQFTRIDPIDAGRLVEVDETRS